MMDDPQGRESLDHFVPVCYMKDFGKRGWIWTRYVGTVCVDACMFGNETFSEDFGRQRFAVPAKWFGRRETGYLSPDGWFQGMVLFIS